MLLIAYFVVLCCTGALAFPVVNLPNRLGSHQALSGPTSLWEKVFLGQTGVKEKRAFIAARNLISYQVTSGTRGLSSSSTINYVPQNWLRTSVTTNANRYLTSSSNSLISSSNSLTSSQSSSFQTALSWSDSNPEFKASLLSSIYNTNTIVFPSATTSYNQYSDEDDDDHLYLVNNSTGTQKTLRLSRSDLIAFRSIIVAANSELASTSTSTPTASASSIGLYNLLSMFGDATKKSSSYITSSPSQSFQIYATKSSSEYISSYETSSSRTPYISIAAATSSRSTSRSSSSSSVSSSASSSSSNMGKINVSSSQLSILALLLWFI